VGAFENDDEDIYSTEDMTNYDFELTANAEKRKKSKGIKPADPYAKIEGDIFNGFELSKNQVSFALLIR
jgi:hypothetical protein